MFGLDKYIPKRGYKESDLKEAETDVEFAETTLNSLLLGGEQSKIAEAKRDLESKKMRYQNISNELNQK